MKPEALIVAQPAYAQWEQLPLAAKAAKELAEALTKHGYSLQHANLLDGGDKPKVEQALGEWFEKTSSDCLVLFWTGHGSSDGGHYLICRNSPRAGLTSFNAIDAQALGPVIANCKAEKILVILDTCYSGLGAGEIASAFSKVLANRVSIPGRERAIAVIASAHPLEKAQEGIFCNTLRSVLFEPTAIRPWSDEDECIHTELLARALKKALPADVSQPDYKADGIGQNFIPNPLFRVGRPAENVEERTWRLLHGVGSEHFDLAARGIEVGESGWFFAGRTELLRRLVTWLEDAPHGVRIVTGPPGAGKSAVMGRLATLSDPDYRKAALRAGMMASVEDGTVPPERIIDVAIHAKGKTLDDCARAVAEALSLPAGKEAAVDIEALVTAIGRIDRRVTIMIDGLDEAASGQGEIIAARLIAPLGRLERVRLLVGSRHSLDGMLVPQGEDRHGRLRAAFGLDAIIDDLEDEPESRQDVAAYVRLRLAADTSKHRGNEAGIRAAAERVAERAQGTFLYARIVSRTLQDLDRLDGELPTTALGAFEQDLRSRFGAHEQRVDDLLAALAWGEGKGLTRRVWPRIAFALTRRERRYDDDDVSWVLGHAGWHIIETGEDGQAVYRLGHQALADHYRGRMEVRDAQDRIIAALTEGIEGAGWLECDRYLWRHLADHAAQAGRLGLLLHEPGYLAVADPARLVALLSGIEDDDSRRFADVYNRVADRLIGQPPLERLPLIHMMAQMEAPDLAPRLEPPVATRWRCRWARMQPSTPHRTIGHGSVGIHAEYATLEGRPIVVTGGWDKTIRLWDIATGNPIGSPIQVRKKVRSMAVCATADDLVVIVASKKSMRAWSVRSGKQIGNPLKGHTRRINFVAATSLNDNAVVISGSQDGTVRIWDLRTCEPVGKYIKLRTSPIALGILEGRPIIFSCSSGDSSNDIFLHDLRTRKRIGEPLRGHKGDVTSIAVGLVDGRQIICSGSWDSTVRRWDARTCKPIGKPLEGHRSVVDCIALGIIDGRPTIVSGSWDGTVRLWDARTGESIGLPLEGHTRSVTSVLIGMEHGHPVVISASPDRTMRLWRTGIQERSNAPREGHTSDVFSVAFGAINNRSVIISGGKDHTIRIWDTATGEPVIGPLTGHEDCVTSVAFGMVDDRSIIISGSNDSSVRKWDACTGELLGDPLYAGGGDIRAVAIGTIDGRPVVIAGSYSSVILLDARTGEMIRRFTAHIVRVLAVALSMMDGCPTIVSGGTDEAIRRWDGRTGNQIGETMEGHKGDVTSLVLSDLDGCPVVVSGSLDASIRLWNGRNGKPIWKRLGAHARGTYAVAVGAINKDQVIVSGGLDYAIRIWDLSKCVEKFAVPIGQLPWSVDIRPNVGIAVGLESGVMLLEVHD
jgi:WD40 repeat protein